MDQRDLLLDYLHQGKEKAYELLYHYYYVPLVLFAGKYVGNEEVAKDIDQEIHGIIDGCHKKAREIILEHEDVLHKCAALLLEKEKVQRDEFEALFTE